MDIIPVIDLVGGVVVRAREGDRKAYRPIRTPLAPSSDPVDIVHALVRVHRFATLYVADLDAIMANGDNLPTLHRLRAEFPMLNLWVDNGATDAAALVGRGLGTPIIGSESQRDSALLAQSNDAVLSLDFRDAVFQGPVAILNQPQLWPQRIIVMTLARVGSGFGPDYARLAAIRAQAGRRTIYAAGGVRDINDLRALKAAGIAGALVATALHDGRLTGAEIDLL